MAQPQQPKQSIVVKKLDNWKVDAFLIRTARFKYTDDTGKQRTSTYSIYTGEDYLYMANRQGQVISSKPVKLLGKIELN